MFVIPEEEIMGYLKKVFFIFLLVYFVFSLTTTVSQELIRQKTMVESAIVVKLESPLKNYKGECPVEVKMTGKIIASSDSKLRYRFTRSDGVSSRWMILKYTEKFNSVEVLLSDTDKKFITIEIKDTGIGIEKINFEKIFNRFYRIDPSRSEKGSGLGLSLSLAIIKEHGGKIDIVSEKGFGSKFIITLPNGNLQVI